MGGGATCLVKKVDTFTRQTGGCEIPSGVTTSISASVSGSKATMERLAAVKGVGLLIPHMSGSKYS